MEKKKSTWGRALAVFTALLVLCSIINWGVITQWGDIKISKVKIAGDDGLTYTALLYTPSGASNAAPAPAALFLHGNSGNARNHESWAVEYARRGFVVLSVDNLGAGDGDFLNAHGANAIPIAFMKYLLTLNYIQPQNIVVGGHSMGGGMAYAVALAFPENVKVMISSNAVMGMSEPGYAGNMIFVNGSADKLNEVVSARVTVAEIFTNNGVDVAEMELGKIYGSFADGQACQYVEIENQIHEAAFIDKDHIAAQLNFVQQAIEAPNAIDASNQVWIYKDIWGLLGMLLFAAWVVVLALHLIASVPFFASIQQPLPRNIGLRKQGLAISVTCAIVFPLLCLFTGAFGLVGLFGARAENLAPVFSLRFTNIALATIIALNVFGFLMLLLFWFTDGKKEKATLRDLGLTSEGKTGFDFVLIGKSLLLTGIVAVIGWLYLALQGEVLGTDFYCLFFGYKPVALQKLIYYVPYLLIWMACFVIAAVGMNVERRLPSTGSEAKDTAIAMVFNIVLAAGTITAMVFVENQVQIALGSSATALAGWRTDITRLWGMPIGMVIGAGGNTYLYRKTGNVWVGAFLMGIMCALTACLYGQIRCF